MRNVLYCTLLFACCDLCLASDPPLPMPPETPVIDATPVHRPALPSAVPTPAGSAVRAAAPTITPVPVQSPPLFVVPFDAGVHYRPEAVVPPANDGLHLRYPYYSYRRPWYPAGPASVNVTIIW